MRVRAVRAVRADVQMQACTSATAQACSAPGHELLLVRRPWRPCWRPL
jgi:hypothetical protein